MVNRFNRATVPAKLFVEGDLVRTEQRPSFEMGSQMHGAQAPLQFADGARLRRKTILSDLSFCELLVECAFALDKLSTERLRRGVHAIENHLYFLPLACRELEFPSEGQNMLRTGVAIQLSGLRHAHALSVEERRDIFI